MNKYKSVEVLIPQEDYEVLKSFMKPNENLGAICQQILHNAIVEIQQDKKGGCENG